MKSGKSSQLKTVISYEFAVFIKNKVFLVTTLIFTILIVGAALVPPMIGLGKEKPGTEEPAKKDVLSVYDSGGVITDKDLFAGLFPDYEVRFETAPFSDSVDMTGTDGTIVALSSDKYEFYGNNTLVSQTSYVVKEGLTTYHQMTAMGAAGLSGAEIVSVLTPPEVTVSDIKGKDAEQTYALTYVLIMVLYISVMLYGQLVAVSVATEKSSRAMELLITSARPNNLIFGKLIGVGLAGLCQLILWVAAAAIAMTANIDFWKSIPFVSGVFSAPPYLFGLMFLFYILGYFMYAAMFGALGSLVSRVEDINTTATPIILLCVAGFMLAMFGMMNPDALVIKICSYIPFFAPLCMFVRISMSVVPVWAIAISIVLTTATSVLFGWLSAKIYRAGVLMYGKPPSVKELVRVLKGSQNY